MRRARERQKSIQFQQRIKTKKKKMLLEAAAASEWKRGGNKQSGRRNKEIKLSASLPRASGGGSGRQK
jgi:hypothetical protein